MWREWVQTRDVDWSTVTARLLEWLLVIDPRRRSTVEGPWGQLVYDWHRRAVRCHICGRWLRTITPSHVVNAHGYSITDYREKFGLPANLRLSAEAARWPGHPAVVDWGDIPKPPDDEELSVRTMMVTQMLALVGFANIFSIIVVECWSAYPAGQLMPRAVYAKLAGTGALAGLGVALSSSTVARYCRDLPPLMAFAIVELLMVSVVLSSYLTVVESLPTSVQVAAGTGITKVTFLLSIGPAWWAGRQWRDSNHSIPYSDRATMDAVTELRCRWPMPRRW